MAWRIRDSVLWHWMWVWGLSMYVCGGPAVFVRSIRVGDCVPDRAYSL